MRQRTKILRRQKTVSKASTKDVLCITITGHSEIFFGQWVIRPMEGHYGRSSHNKFNFRKSDKENTYPSVGTNLWTSAQRENFSKQQCRRIQIVEMLLCMTHANKESKLSMASFWSLCIANEQFSIFPTFFQHVANRI